MFSEVRRIMSLCTKNMNLWLNKRPKLKQWLWFILLWLGGFLSVYTVAYLIKIVMRSLA